MWICPSGSLEPLALSGCLWGDSWLCCRTVGLREVSFGGVLCPPTHIPDLALLLLLAGVGVEHMECEIKLEAPASPDGEPGKEETDEGKKRKRKPYRPGRSPGDEGGSGGEVRGDRRIAPCPPSHSLSWSHLFLGIGGFMVRQRKSHARLKKGPAVLVEVLSGEGQPDEGELSWDTRVSKVSRDHRVGSGVMAKEGCK